METNELLKKVRAIEIKTRGLSNHIFSGEYQSAFKGRGMTFNEVREYQAGDDVRAIDWNVTARFSHPYIKVFEEERELTVMLIVDVSASGEFGTQHQFKNELVTELCAVLAFSAIQNNDKIGVIFFSDTIELFIPPKKGKSHILRIIRELIELKPQSKGTNIGEALRYFNNVTKKRSVAFLISDFLGTDFTDPLKIANRKHDLVAVKVADNREFEWPAVGLLHLQDTETGKRITIDTDNKAQMNAYKQYRLAQEHKLNDTLARSGVDKVEVRTGEDYIKPLKSLFEKRGHKK